MLPVAAGSSGPLPPQAAARSCSSSAARAPRARCAAPAPSCPVRRREHSCAAKSMLPLRTAPGTWVDGAQAGGVQEPRAHTRPGTRHVRQRHVCSCAAGHEGAPSPRPAPTTRLQEAACGTLRPDARLRAAAGEQCRLHHARPAGWPGERQGRGRGRRQAGAGAGAAAAPDAAPRLGSRGGWRPERSLRLLCSLFRDVLRARGWPGPTARAASACG